MCNSKKNNLYFCSVCEKYIPSGGVNVAIHNQTFSHRNKVKNRLKVSCGKARSVIQAERERNKLKNIISRTSKYTIASKKPEDSKKSSKKVIDPSDLLEELDETQQTRWFESIDMITEEFDKHQLFKRGLWSKKVDSVTSQNYYFNKALNIAVWKCPYEQIKYENHQTETFSLLAQNDSLPKAKIEPVIGQWTIKNVDNHKKNINIQHNREAIYSQKLIESTDSQNHINCNPYNNINNVNITSRNNIINETSQANGARNTLKLVIPLTVNKRKNKPNLNIFK